MSSQNRRNGPVSDRPGRLTLRIDLLIYRISKHWVAVFSLIIGIYVGLPILAPVLMASGMSGPARAIYTAYSPFCHQMASRSFFLFGEQIAYPREIAGTNLTPIEAYMESIPEFQNASSNPDEWASFVLPARRFVGNATMGYKTALCERDIAIYGFVLLGSIGYGLLRKRVKIPPMPIWLFFLLGLGPIALDGFSQLFGQYAVAVPALSRLAELLPLRESTPFLRTLTGAMFGFSLVWLTYPRIETGMQQTEHDLGAKLVNAGVLSQS